MYVAQNSAKIIQPAHCSGQDKSPSTKLNIKPITKLLSALVWPKNSSLDQLPRKILKYPGLLPPHLIAPIFPKFS